MRPIQVTQIIVLPLSFGPTALEISRHTQVREWMDWAMRVTLTASHVLAAHMRRTVNYEIFHLNCMHYT